MVRNQSCPGNHIFIYAVHDTFYASPTSIKGQIEKASKPVQAERTQVSIYVKYGRQYGIDPKLLKAIARVESGENPELIGDGGDSIGLMQVQPKWHSQRLKDEEDLLDPEVNIRVACEYLTELMAQYGDLDKVLTAYNAGHDTGSRVYANKIYEEMKND